MECRDVREMADSFLAEELLTETNHDILRHIGGCPVCRAELAARRELRERLKRAFHTTGDLGARPEFVDQLRNTLEGAAREVPARRRIRFAGWWALAATMLLAVAVGRVYVGRDWWPMSGSLSRDAVGDHRNCALQFRLADKPISLQEAARRYGAPYHALEDVPPNEVQTATGPARVLERHLCIYNGRRFAHVVFEYRHQRVSLLVTADDGVFSRHISGSASPGAISATIADHMAVGSFRTPGHLTFVVGDMPEDDVLALTRALAGPLAKALTGA